MVTSSAADDGRRRFVEYITTLENVVSDALAAAQREGKGSSRSPAAEGFMPA